MMHFDAPGPQNTEKTLQLAAERAKALGIAEMVVATTSGQTARRALEICRGLKITAVAYHCGFEKPFTPVMPESVRKDLESSGIRVVSATHALSGVERSVFNKYSGPCPVLLIADTLRLFGQGTKVAVEIAVMAADAGTLSGKDIVSVGGSAHGADAALVIKPAHQSGLFDLRIREIICKPRNF
jgi:hypothetical protein